MFRVLMWISGVLLAIETAGCLCLGGYFVWFFIHMGAEGFTGAEATQTDIGRALITAGNANLIWWLGLAVLFAGTRYMRKKEKAQAAA